MKVSALINDKFFSKKLNELPKSSDLKEYIENSYKSMIELSSNHEKLKYFLFDNANGLYYYCNTESNIKLWGDESSIIKILDLPDFLKYHENFSITGDNDFIVDLLFRKSNLMEIYSFDEFLPLNSFSCIAKFLNFLLNTLNIRIDLFEKDKALIINNLFMSPNFKIDNTIVDASGKSILLEPFICEYINRMLQISKDFLGNDFFTTIKNIASEKNLILPSTSYGDLIYSNIETAIEAGKKLNKPENHTLLAIVDNKFMITTNNRAKIFTDQKFGNNVGYFLFNHKFKYLESFNSIEPVYQNLITDSFVLDKFEYIKLIKYCKDLKISNSEELYLIIENYLSEKGLDYVNYIDDITLQIGEELDELGIVLTH